MPDKTKKIVNNAKNINIATQNNNFYNLIDFRILLVLVIIVFFIGLILILKFNSSLLNSNTSEKNSLQLPEIQQNTNTFLIDSNQNLTQSNTYLSNFLPVIANSKRISKNLKFSSERSKFSFRKSDKKTAVNFPTPVPIVEPCRYTNSCDK